MSKLWRTDRIKRPGYPPRPTQHANTADATVSLTRLPEQLCHESGPHKPSLLRFLKNPLCPLLGRAFPTSPCFPPQENSSCSLAVAVIKDSERPGGRTHTRQGRTGTEPRREQPKANKRGRAQNNGVRESTRKQESHKGGNPRRATDTTGGPQEELTRKRISV